MRRVLALTSIIILVLCPFAGRISAQDVEEPLRGRLPDGRAFRTDAQGNQLVDYIAELELSVEALNRRVHGLEDEVQARQRVIDRINQKQPLFPSLEERDLVGTGAAQAPQNAFEQKGEFAVGQEPAGSGAAPDCGPEAAHLEHALQTARVQIDSQRRQCESQARQYRAAITNLGGRLGMTEADIRRMRDQQTVSGTEFQQKLESQEIDVEFERQVHSSETAGMQERIALLEKNLAAKDKELEEARSAEAVKVVADKAAENADSKQAPAGPAATEVKAVPAPEQAVSKDARASLAAAVTAQRPASPARNRAVESVRGSMIGELNRVRSLQTSRDSLFAGAHGRKGTVGLKPSRAVSSEGRTLDAIRKEIEAAGSIHQLSPLRSDLNQIKRILQDDMALIKRMGAGGKSIR